MDGRQRAEEQNSKNEKKQDETNQASTWYSCEKQIGCVWFACVFGWLCLVGASQDFVVSYPVRAGGLIGSKVKDPMRNLIACLVVCRRGCERGVTD